MPERARIALCLEYPLALRGGVSVLVENLLEGLRDRFELVLVSPDDGAEVTRRGIERHIHWKPDSVNTANARRLARLIASQNVKLAHFHMGGNYGWGHRIPGHCPITHLKKLGVKTLSSVHLVVSPLDGYCGAQKPLWFKLAMLPLAWMGKMQQLWHVKKEIAVSRHDAALLCRWYAPLSSRITQIYHSRLRADSQNDGKSTRQKVVLNVGHSAWRKGQIVLAEAFAKVAPRHPEWRLVMPGGFLEEQTVQRIRQIATEHHLENRVELPGERQDAMEMMKVAGIYVQPSYYEALGLALQEALFQGCPSIGSRAGGIPELIEQGRTGLLVEPGNVEQLAAALDELMSDPVKRLEFGRRGAESILQKGMTLDQMIRNHIELYETILEGH